MQTMLERAPLVRQSPSPLRRVQATLARLASIYVPSPRYRDGLGAVLDPAMVKCASEVMDWAEHTIGAPNKEIGRNGAVCPFVPRALSTKRFHIVLRPEVRGDDDNELRSVIMSYASLFLKHYAIDDKDHAMANITLVFPNIPEARGEVIARVHTELKSLLMHRGIMCSSFHPHAEKPAIRNPEFRHAYKAPYACFTMRHMGLHDIIFLDHNEEGFDEYERRFGAKYEANKVSNEHGYVDLYNAALARFG